MACIGIELTGHEGGGAASSIRLVDLEVMKSMVPPDLSEWIGIEAHYRQMWVIQRWSQVVGEGGCSIESVQARAGARVEA